MTDESDSGEQDSLAKEQAVIHESRRLLADAAEHLNVIYTDDLQINFPIFNDHLWQRTISFINIYNTKLTEWRKALGLSHEDKRLTRSTLFPRGSVRSSLDTYKEASIPLFRHPMAAAKNSTARLRLSYQSALLNKQTISVQECGLAGGQNQSPSLPSSLMPPGHLTARQRDGSKGPTGAETLPGTTSPSKKWLQKSP